MTRVLVTGATGLTGSNVCVAALDDGDDVRAVMRAQARADELEALGVEIFRGDIIDRAAVLEAADGCEYCVHCAALVVGGARWPYAAYQAVNVTGTANVLDAAEHHAIARTVCLSTASAFGRSQTLTEDLTTSVGALNLALEIAERPYRVRALTPAEMQAPDVLARWGPSQIRAATQFADPPVRNMLTIERLAHHPTPLRQAREQTVAWMLQNNLV